MWGEAEAALAGSISEASSIWTPVVVSVCGSCMCSLTVSPALGRLGQENGQDLKVNLWCKESFRPVWASVQDPD